MSHLGGSLSQLVESPSYLEESWTIWKGPGVSCEGLGARWETRGGKAERDRDRMEHWQTPKFIKIGKLNWL